MIFDKRNQDSGVIQSISQDKRSLSVSWNDKGQTKIQKVSILDHLASFENNYVTIDPEELKYEYQMADNMEEEYEIDDYDDYYDY